MSQYAVELQVDIAAIDAKLVSPEFVVHAHMYNLDVWCYTVNFERDFTKLRDMGVDAVFSNDPALLSEYNIINKQ
jgi:glycerophosphoryl diester phosphodiesterase